MKWLWLGALLAGCETIEAGKYAPDPGQPPGSAIDTGEPEGADAAIDCDEYADFNWVNFGNGFFIEACNGCHHSDAPYRYGAPEDIHFDDVNEVWAQKGFVMMVAAGDNPTMPPNGGTTELDRLKLEIWLTCGTVGN